MRLIFDETDADDALEMAPPDLLAAHLVVSGGRVIVEYHAWDEELVEQFEAILKRKHISYDKE